MHGGLRQERAQLLNLAQASHATENRSEVHGITLAGPDAGYRIVIAGPAIAPHQAGFLRELVGDLLPESDVSRIGIGKRFIGVRRRKHFGPGSQNRCALSYAGLKINRAERLDDCASSLLRTKAAGYILAALP